MRLIPDDPIVSSLLARGYPPWIEDDDEDDFDSDGDVYYGNATDEF